MTQPTNPELRQLFEFLDSIAQKTANNSAICEARELVFDLEVGSGKKSVAIPFGTYYYEAQDLGDEPSRIEIDANVSIEYPPFEEGEPILKFKVV